VCGNSDFSCRSECVRYNFVIDFTDANENVFACSANGFSGRAFVFEAARIGVAFIAIKK